MPADSLRLATFNTELARDGPGLLLRDLVRGKDDDITHVLEAITGAQADILLLLGIDIDYGGATPAMLAKALRDRDLDYPYMIAAPPNTGLRSGLDLNGDGRLHDPQDAQGFGTFPGQGGMMLLSRLPLGQLRDHSAMLWQDMQGHDPPRHPDGSLFPSEQAFAAQRLAAVAHWQVPVLRDGATLLTLTALHAAAPVFDGPEDRNGRRNADELRFALSQLGPGPVALMGTLNLDPFDSDGILPVIRQVLNDPHLQDPVPASAESAARGTRDSGVNLNHTGDPAFDTADWRDARPGQDPGNLRVDYVLPDRRFTVLDAGLIWPETGRRALVWVDLDMAPP